MASGTMIDVPDMKCAYLFDYLLKIGTMTFNGMANVPLSWQELNAWVQVTGTPLNVWELKVIHRASEVYVSQVELSRKADAPMPERIIVQDQAKLAKRIKSVLR